VLHIALRKKFFTQEVVIVTVLAQTFLIDRLASLYLNVHYLYWDCTGRYFQVLFCSVFCSTIDVTNDITEALFTTVLEYFFLFNTAEINRCLTIFMDVSICRSVYLLYMIEQFSQLSNGLASHTVTWLLVWWQTKTCYIDRTVFVTIFVKNIKSLPSWTKVRPVMRG
jgi:hypothetical protein